MEPFWRRLRRAVPGVGLVIVAVIATALLYVALPVLLFASDLLQLFGFDAIKLPSILLLVRDHLLWMAIIALALALVVPDAITLFLFWLHRPRPNDHERENLALLKARCGRIMDLTGYSYTLMASESPQAKGELRDLRASMGNFIQWDHLHFRIQSFCFHAGLIQTERGAGFLFGGELPYTADDDKQRYGELKEAYNSLVAMVDDMLSGPTIQDSWIKLARRTWPKGK